LKNISFFGDEIEKENNTSGIEEKCGHHIYISNIVDIYTKNKSISFEK